MMMIFVAVLSALAVTFTVVAVSEFVPARDRNISRKLAELEEIASTRTLAQKRRRQTKREQLEVWLETLGEKVAEGQEDVGPIREKLLQAGYRSPRAVPIYFSLRIVSLVSGALLIAVLAPVMSLSGTRLLVWVGAAAAAGWFLPGGGLSRKVRMRQIGSKNANEPNAMQEAIKNAQEKYLKDKQLKEQNG